MKKPGQRKPLAKTAEIVAASTAGTLDRGTRGRKRDDASFPVAPLSSEMPVGYATALGEIKRRIQEERLRAVMAANSAMVMLYWDIGHLILDRQEKEGWGAKVIDRLSADLREAYPDMKGLSPRNLKYMRAFASAWTDRSFVQQLAAQIPWFHNCILLDRVSDPATRMWYIKAAIEHGWSTTVRTPKEPSLTSAWSCPSCSTDAHGQWPCLLTAVSPTCWAKWTLACSCSKT